MLGGIDMSRAEKDRKSGERHGDEQRRIAQHGLCRAGPGGEGGHDRIERRRYGFELKRDVGDHADDGDHRHGRRHALMLAITCADKIRDRDDVLCLGKAGDARDQRKGEPDHRDGPDIDRQEIKPCPRGEADRTKKCPGRAVDGKRQRVDQRPRAIRPAESAQSVAIARDDEQQPNIDERDYNDEPALQHAVLLLRLPWRASPACMSERST